MAASLVSTDTGLESGGTRNYTLSSAPLEGSCLIAITVARFTSTLLRWDGGLSQSNVTWQKIDETSNGSLSHAMWMAIPSNVGASAGTTLTVTGSNTGNVNLYYAEFSGARDDTAANILTATLVSSTTTDATSPRYVPHSMRPSAPSPDTYTAAHDNVLGLGFYFWVEDSSDTYTGTPNDGFTILDDPSTSELDFVLCAKQMANTDEVQPYLQTSDNRRTGIVLGLRGTTDTVPAVTEPDPPLATAAAFVDPYSLTEKTPEVLGRETEDRLLRQFKELGAGANIQGFANAVGQLFGESEATLFDIPENLLDPDTAAGVHLTRLGALVGESRNGRTDTNYRIAIKGRIAANRSGGTWPEILNILHLTLGDGFVATLRVNARRYWSIQISGVTVTETVFLIVKDATGVSKRGQIIFVPTLANALILTDNDPTAAPTGATGDHNLVDDDPTSGTGGELAGIFAE